MDGDEREGVLDHDELRNLLREGKIAFPTITQEEIQDRSKADGLAKGSAVLQTTWFIAQCISRTAQGLIITEIELMTLAFAALNGILYFLWWNKPLDVKCCVPVLLLHGEDRKPVVIPPFEPKRKLFYLIWCTRLSHHYFCTKKLPGRKIHLFLIRLVKIFLLAS